MRRRPVRTVPKTVGMHYYKSHVFAVTIEWTGNTGTGTSGYRAYERSHVISAGTKPSIAGSSDPSFRGDASCWSPEELLIASLAACHKLWYLHLCSVSGVVVTEYIDRAEGTMVETEDGGGHFTSVLLRPHVTIDADSDVEVAKLLHADARAKCFIANSINFEVGHEALIRVAVT